MVDNLGFYSLATTQLLLQYFPLDKTQSHVIETLVFLSEYFSIMTQAIDIKITWDGGTSSYIFYSVSLLYFKYPNRGNTLRYIQIVIFRY